MENASKPDEGLHVIWAPLLKRVFASFKMFHECVGRSTESGHGF